MNDMPLHKAARIAGVPVSDCTLRRHLVAGDIAGRRVGGRWFVTPEAIRAGMVRVVGAVKP